MPIIDCNQNELVDRLLGFINFLLPGDVFVERTVGIYENEPAVILYKENTDGSEFRAAWILKTKGKDQVLILNRQLNPEVINDLPIKLPFPLIAPKVKIFNENDIIDGAEYIVKWLLNIPMAKKMPWLI